MTREQSVYESTVSKSASRSFAAWHPTWRIKGSDALLSERHMPVRGGLERQIDGVVYRFGCATSSRELELAGDLVARRYAWRGYDFDWSATGDSDSGEATFVAYQGSRAVGTLTVRVDSQTVLLAEALYAQELKRLRHEGGARMCEFVRLAFDEGVNTLEILGPLSHLGMAYALRCHRSTDLVIEVNPRHVGFYRRAFGGEVLGEERICSRVAAPALLLRLPLRQAMQAANLEGGERTGRRSIYPYFFGRHELGSLHLELPLAGIGGPTKVRELSRSYS